MCRFSLVSCSKEMIMNFYWTAWIKLCRQLGFVTITQSLPTLFFNKNFVWRPNPTYFFYFCLDDPSINLINLNWNFICFRVEVLSITWWWWAVVEVRNTFSFLISLIQLGILYLKTCANRTICCSINLTFKFTWCLVCGVYVLYG